MTNSVIAVGMSLNTQINCIASNGRGERYHPSNRQQIEDALTDFFINTVGVQP